MKLIPTFTFCTTVLYPRLLRGLQDNFYLPPQSSYVMAQSQQVMLAPLFNCKQKLAWFSWFTDTPSKETPQVFHFQQKNTQRNKVTWKHDKHTAPLINPTSCSNDSFSKTGSIKCTTRQVAFVIFTWKQVEEQNVNSRSSFTIVKKK